METDEALDGVARSLLDGTPIDWAALYSRVDPTLHSTLGQLRLLERLRDVHQQPPTTAPHPEYWRHLRLLEEIGRGAYGIVYRAWDPWLDRFVALKLWPASRGSADSRPTLIEEGRLLARVHHPNVVAILGAEQIEDQIGLWMEFVEGRTLEQRLRGDGRLGAADTVAIGIELCQALRAVHAAGLLHRDIKANNVMQARDGRIVLMDFGAGLDLADDAEPDLAGTPLYLAPEAFLGRSATVQGDLYALGVLLYHLATGTYPVEGRTIRDVRLAHERGERVPLRRRRPDLPAGLTAAIDRALAADPSRRYSDAERLRAALADAMSGRTVARWIGAGPVVAALARRWWALRVDREPAVTGQGLAVLAFRSQGTVADDRTLARGFAASVHQLLARAPALRVHSFEASSRVPVARSPEQAGAELGSEYVLDGDVSARGERVTVEVRLIRVRDGTKLWARTFERRPTELFETQEEVSIAVARALGVPLALRPRYEPAPDLQLRYYRARTLQETRSRENLLEAARQYGEIVAIDSAFAAAFAGLAMSLIHADRLRGGDVSPENDRRIVEAVSQAVALDPELHEAQLARASLAAYRLRWAEAERVFLRAFDLNRSTTVGYTEFVLSTLLPQQRYDEALRYLEDARRLDPVDLDVQRVIALVQLESGRYADAIRTCMDVLDRDAGFPWIKLWLGRAYALSDRLEDAVKVFLQVENRRDGYLGFALARLGRFDEAAALAGRLSADPASQMLVFAGLRDREQAFEALSRLLTANPRRAATWMTRPEMDLLRGDDRYAQYRLRLGLSCEIVGRGGRPSD